MRGRKSKPTELLRVQGTLDRSRHANRDTEPKPSGDLFEPPADMPEVEKGIWRYAVENAPRGLLKNLDRSVFETWVRAVDAQRVAHEVMTREGIVTGSPQGGTVEHPAVRTFQKMSLLLLRCAEQLGFSPAARPRVHVDPEAEKTNPFEAFGAAARAKTLAAGDKSGPKVH